MNRFNFMLFIWKILDWDMWFKYLTIDMNLNETKFISIINL